MANTYYAEATVIATGEEMFDSGLTSAQVEKLREVERQGRISNLRVMDENFDIVAAFRNSVRI